jgi:hypothetical protein
LDGGGEQSLMLQGFRLPMSRSCSPLAFLVDEGAWMMVASTIVPVAMPMLPGLQMYVHSLQHQTTQIVRLQRMAEPADAGLVRRRSTAKINAHKAPQRSRIIELALQNAGRSRKLIIKMVPLALFILSVGFECRQLNAIVRMTGSFPVLSPRPPV